MERQWTTIDKAEWGPGAWQDEPDKKQWLDEATGLPCLAVRNTRLGFWCGYVGVSPAHPAYGLDAAAIEAIALEAIDVHGGLSFAAKCDHDEDPSRGICHIPEPGAADTVWWFGFDCAHFMDKAPGGVALGGAEYLGHSGTYRDLSYVERECGQLAAQLVVIAAKPGVLAGRPV